MVITQKNKTLQTNQCNGTKQRNDGKIAHEADINDYSIFTYAKNKNVGSAEIV